MSLRTVLANVISSCHALFQHQKQRAEVIFETTTSVMQRLKFVLLGKAHLIFRIYWMLDVSETVSYEITLVRLSVCPSIRH